MLNNRHNISCDRLISTKFIKLCSKPRELAYKFAEYVNISLDRQV